MKKIYFLLIPVLLFAGCTGMQRQRVPALDLTDLDTSVSPAVDFYKYATGGWQKKNPLKPQYSRYGSFDAIAERNEEQLNALFADMTKMKTEAGTVEQKISDIYKMALDSTTRNELGAAPIKPYLDQIQAIGSKEDLIRAVAEMHNSASGGFFGAYVEADLKDSDNQILYIGQGGLGMGDRDYYLDADKAELKKGYSEFVKNIFTLAGVAEPEKAMDNVLLIETALARESWDRIKRRDVEAGYNPMSTAEIVAKYPNLHFAEYFAARNIPDQEKIIVGEPSYFEGLDRIVKTYDLQALKDYLSACLISDSCSALSDDFYDAYWEFFSHQLAGAQEQQPRWKRAMRVPNSLLGEAVGKMYVDRYFPETSKKMMQELVENLRIALGQHIDSLDWMSDTTKVRAHEKLAAFTVKIGYPDKWKDYSTLNVDPALSYFENIQNAGKWFLQDNLSKLGKPTDKTEWGMTPQTVNAYYNPTTNEICFPAGILQKPFFDPNADAAVNYGGIGVVIGHEMSHGFDDQGSMFDAHGNMVNWWTPADKAKFDAKGKALAAQFDAVEVLPGLHANGSYTLGENIGDHGGLSIAFTAMQNVIAGKEPGLIDGFTPEQRFYLSYATIWAQNITDQEKARRTQMDVHSLAENRVNVSIRNFQTFFDAFGIKEGDPMFRPEAERVHIW